MKEQIIEKWSTLKEVQEYLGVGRDTILQWIAKRNIHFISMFCLLMMVKRIRRISWKRY